ncbi:MAG: hypothetical protein AAF702_04050 [Chloroflexota bacterium]
MTRQALPLMKIKGRHLLIFLLIGGQITLWEVTNRINFVGGLSADGLRNMILLFVALMGVTLFAAQRSGKVPNVWRIWPYILFVFWAELSILWTTELSYTIRDGLKLVYPILFYILVSLVLRSDGDSKAWLQVLRRILQFFVILSCASALVSIIANLGSLEWGVDRLHKLPFYMRSPVAISVILLEFAGWRKIPDWRLNWPIIGMALMLVVMTITRSFIFSMAIGIAAIFFVSVRQLHWQIASIALCVTLCLGVLTVDNPVKRRMFWEPDEITASFLLKTMFTNPGRFLLDSQYVEERVVRLAGRLRYWNILLTESRNRRPAILGSGLGSARPIMAVSYYQTVSHGDYAKYLGELGYVGFSLFLFIYGLLLVWSWSWTYSKRLSAVGHTCAIVLFALTAVSVTVSIVYDIFFAAYDFQVIAILLIAILQTEISSMKHNAALIEQRA